MSDGWDDVQVAVPGTVAVAALPGKAEERAAGWAPPLGSEIWQARRTLQSIHQFARARRTAPWAVLGVVLARVVAVTPPNVVLPPLVGGHGSLNIFVALVGPSGAGKGAAERAAAEVVPVGDLVTASVGSGEGLAHLYARRVRNAVERHTDNVLLTVAEVDTLTALGSRRGATLLPELRKAWSGEDLGFSYADPDKRLPIAAHSYRLSMIIGVQPARAGALLEDADGGTPQRLIWLPATDPEAPDLAPPEPFGVEWSPPRWPAGHHRTGRIELKICDAAVQVVDASRLAGLRGQTTGLEAHAPLARLKTAAALALLEGRAEVTDEDWELAGVVATLSTRTRERVGLELQRAEHHRNVARGEMEGQRAAVAADALNAAAAQRVARALLRMLADGAWASRKDLRGRLASRDRQLFEDAVDRLVDAGQIEVDAVSADALGREVTGQRYRVMRGAR